MPSTLLFAINNEGRVFGLSTKGTKWREFMYLGLEFKQLSAVPNFLWAVGGDRQIYVHAHGLDIPIRVREEAYENERWYPVDGFCNKLLPTDRYNFSNQDGTVDRTLTKIRLPSMAWRWEGDWKLDLSLNGEPLDHDGWTYAVDFPATYYPTQQWTSYVRRRKWIRYRRYIAVNSWCAIAPLHKDPTKEPFIGVAVGGTQLPGAEVGTILVWAVTAYGRVMFRHEVSSTFPEGQRWSSIPVPPGCEVSQVSVGTTGLVWVVLWNGKALVRIGISRNCVTGNGWAEVEQPGDNLLLNQVSIGCNGLWAITRDSRVWFRKGIEGENSGVSETYAKGTGWVEMIGSMANVSVASNDQVWAVGAEDRTSVTQDDLMGKTWRAMGAPTQLSRASSSLSLISGGGEGTPKEKRHRSWASLNRFSSSQENHSGNGLDISEACHSAPAAARNNWRKSADSSLAKSFSSIQSSNSDDLSSSFPTNPYNIPEGGVEKINEKIGEVKEYVGKEDCPSSVDSQQNISYENDSRPVCGFISKEVTIPTRSWSPQHAGGTVVAAEAHCAADSSVFESDELTGIYSEHGEREDEDDHLYWADSEAFWLTVEAGACLVNVNYLPNWFTDVSTDKKSELAKPWRMKILNELQNRLPVNLEGLEKYEKAIDSSTWVKAGNCKCQLQNEVTFRDCIIELEWVCGENDNFDCGTLTLSSLNKTETWAQINLRDLTGVIGCSVPRGPRLALYYGSTKFLKLLFGTEDEFEEWKSELSTVCCRIRNIPSTPSVHSIWVTTVIGDIYVCDLSLISMEQNIANSGKHTIERCFSGNELPISMPLQSGFLPGSSLTITGCVHDQAKRFSIDLVCSDDTGNNNIAFHFNPRFNEEQVIQNALKGSLWGQEKRSKCQPFKPGTIFELQIICQSNCFEVLIDNANFTEFPFRIAENDRELSPSYITRLDCSGDINISKIKYMAGDVIIEPTSMFWRQIAGHLKKVESAGGITWGIGFDNTAWLFTESCSSHRIRDTHYYYVYENQRWNPLTGYTSHGLPTDRFMWSDITGKHKRTKEETMLLSKKWNWVNYWSVDFYTPGGVDKEGWQYAVDFPYSYHGTEHVTDCVRRRRWYRRARLETEGPWVELGYTPLSDCSLYSDGTEITAWAIAPKGYVLFRRGVSKTCPAGHSWEHVPSDEQMVSISCWEKQVWTVGKSGSAFCRVGITIKNPIGDFWERVKAPVGTTLKQISVGKDGIWVLDGCGRISVRKEILPIDSQWTTLPLISNEQNTKDECGLPSTPITTASSSGFRQVAAKDQVWGVTNSGRIAHRIGVNSENHAGSSWLFGVEAYFLHTSS